MTSNTTALAKVTKDLAEARLTVAGLLAEVEASYEPSDIKDVMARTKLAREWAKIQGIAKEMHLDLLRLEISCLRRIAKLGQCDVLPIHSRSAATYYANTPEDVLEDTLPHYMASTTAVGVFRAIMRTDRDQGDYEAGRRFASGKHRLPGDNGDLDDPSHFDVQYYRNNIAAAAVALLDDFASRPEFSIADMVDEVIDHVGIGPECEEPFLSAFRRGVTQVCAATVRSAPALELGNLRAPAFVTCQTRDGYFVRVPTAAARVRQLGDMVAMRKEQLAQDQAAFDLLEDFYRAVSDEGAQEETIGAVVARRAGAAA